MMRCNYCGLSFQELGEGVYDNCPYCTPRALPDSCYDFDDDDDDDDDDPNTCYECGRTLTGHLSCLCAECRNREEERFDGK